MRTSWAEMLANQLEQYVKTGMISDSARATLEDFRKYMDIRRLYDETQQRGAEELAAMSVEMFGLWDKHRPESEKPKEDREGLGISLRAMDRFAGSRKEP